MKPLPISDWLSNLSNFHEIVLHLKDLWKFKTSGCGSNDFARKPHAILYTKEVFTLAGISGIQILVFASRSKSWDFYKCGHKNLTNYCDQHRAANRNTSCDYLGIFHKRDYLGISAIICITADVWTLEQIILVSYQNKGNAWYQACAVRWPESSRSAISKIFPLVWTSAKISQYFNRDGNLDLSCVWMRLNPHSFFIAKFCKMSVIQYYILNFEYIGRFKARGKGAHAPPPPC